MIQAILGAIGVPGVPSKIVGWDPMITRRLKQEPDITITTMSVQIVGLRCTAMELAILGLEAVARVPFTAIPIMP